MPHVLNCGLGKHEHATWKVLLLQQCLFAPVEFNCGHKSATNMTEFRPPSVMGILPHFKQWRLSLISTRFLLKPVDEVIMSVYMALWFVSYVLVTVVCSTGTCTTFLNSHSKKLWMIVSRRRLNKMRKISMR